MDVELVHKLLSGVRCDRHTLLVGCRQAFT
jgi:hypothetical protein